MIAFRTLVGLAAVCVPASISVWGTAPVPKETPVKTLSVPVGKAVTVTFCWIPKGESELGAADGELDAHWKESKFVPPPGFGDDEKHANRGKVEVAGFWLGKYEVTQRQWDAIRKDTPNRSHFRAGGKRAKEVLDLDTSDFPTDNLSWEDCQSFLTALNTLEGVKEIGVARLPTENEWEYACRGGRGHKQPFYFGGELNGTQANCAGILPFPIGVSKKGPWLARTTKVGSYASAAPHPWGLCDMSGNVSEWCDSWYDDTKRLKVMKGGSWKDAPEHCRSASRVPMHEASKGFASGMRILLAPK